MTGRRELTGEDAIRLLCNTVQMVHFYEKHDEGISIAGRDTGELILQDALQYLAHGDTNNARNCMDEYDHRQETGEAPWPCNGEPPPEWFLTT